jgi:hypothetical protein
MGFTIFVMLVEEEGCTKFVKAHFWFFSLGSHGFSAC